MREYRKRRRRGVQYIRLPLHVTDIDMLIERGLLDARQRGNREAITIAVCDLLYQVADDAA